MKKSDAIKYFGTSAALADALGIRPQAVHQWGDLIPLKRAKQIEEATKGKLKVVLRKYGSA